MLEIRILPPEIAAGIGPRGNPEIYGVDNQAGIIVTIEIDSAHWQDALAGFARVRGVGIYPANALPVEKGRKDAT